MSWGLGSDLVSPVPCLGDPLGVVGAKENKKNLNHTAKYSHHKKCLNRLLDGAADTKPRFGSNSFERVNLSPQPKI